MVCAPNGFCHAGCTCGSCWCGRCPGCQICKPTTPTYPCGNCGVCGCQWCGICESCCKCGHHSYIDAGRGGHTNNGHGYIYACRTGCGASYSLPGGSLDDCCQCVGQHDPAGDIYCETNHYDNSGHRTFKYCGICGTEVYVPDEKRQTSHTKGNCPDCHGSQHDTASLDSYHTPNQGHWQAGGCTKSFTCPDRRNCMLNPPASGYVMGYPGCPYCSSPAFHEMIVTICNVNSNKYLNVDNGYTNDGTNVYQWTYDGSMEQHFRLVYDTSNSAYRIHPLSSDLGYTSPIGANSSNNVVLNGSTNLFEIISLGSNLYNIKGKSGSLYMTSYGTGNGSSAGTSSTSAGNVFMASNNSSNSQKWIISEAVTVTKTFQIRNYSNNFGIPSASLDIKCKSNAERSYYIPVNSSGNVTVKFLASKIYGVNAQASNHGRNYYPNQIDNSAATPSVITIELQAYNSELPRSEFVAPLASVTVTSLYGWRCFNGSSGIVFEIHRGLDLYAAIGTDFRSMCDGKVVASNDYGNSRGILKVVSYELNGKNYYFIYQHLRDSTGAGVNAEPKKGGNIGKTGDSGSLGSPHLHVEIQVGEWTYGAAGTKRTIDPRMLF